VNVNDGVAGKTHFWWLGWEARIVITELDLVKEIFANKNGSYEKSQIQLRFQSQLLGKGLVTTNGEEWVTHRQTVAPAFHHEKIKVQFREHVQFMSKNNT
jgi:cytochrome P450